MTIVFHVNTIILNGKSVIKDFVVNNYENL